jgi:ornithine decarboxylase
MLEYLTKEYEIQLFNKKFTIPDMIRYYLETNINEEAFYIIHINNIINSYKTWKQMLPDIEPYYAVKCNSNPVLLKVLFLLGCNFDCASENEIKNILKITGDPTRIIFANPCKIKSHLEYANKNNVSLMTFDCEEELYKIKDWYPSAKLIIRIAVDDSNSLCKFSSKFGCTIKDVGYLLELTKQLGLFVEGVSFHVGSGCMSQNSFYEAIRDCKQVFNIAKQLDLELKIVDIGGGFPGNNKKIHFKDIVISIRNGINDFFFEEVYNKQIKFIAEPGRYFAQNSHTLILCITGKKSIQDETGEKRFVYYLNDGLYNSFNCIIFDHATFDIIPLVPREEGRMYKSKLFGPTCDSMDLIKENILLHEYFIGDYFYVKDFGAYTVSPSSGFNGFSTSINKYVLTDNIEN